jgi:hypothetical protein
MEFDLKCDSFHTEFMVFSVFLTNKFSPIDIVLKDRAALSSNLKKQISILFPLCWFNAPL